MYISVVGSCQHHQFFCLSKLFVFLKTSFIASLCATSYPKTVAKCLTNEESVFIQNKCPTITFALNSFVCVCSFLTDQGNW